jgi:hypothetical protein
VPLRIGDQNSEKLVEARRDQLHTIFAKLLFMIPPIDGADARPRAAIQKVEVTTLVGSNWQHPIGKDVANQFITIIDLEVTFPVANFKDVVHIPIVWIGRDDLNRTRRIFPVRPQESAIGRGQAGPERGFQVLNSLFGIHDAMLERDPIWINRHPAPVLELSVQPDHFLVVPSDGCPADPPIFVETK